jgi:hypothetical protein
MHQNEALSVRSWVAIWKRAGSELEAIRQRELKCVDTQRAMLSLGDAFESAVLDRPLSVSSGMIEMQRLFCRVADGAVDQNRR